MAQCPIGRQDEDCGTSTDVIGDVELSSDVDAAEEAPDALAPQRLGRHPRIDGFGKRKRSRSDRFREWRHAHTPHRGAGRHEMLRLDARL